MSNLFKSCLHKKKDKDRNKPNFILKFSDEKLTPEQDNEILAAFIFTLMRWHDKEQMEAGNNGD